MCIPIAFRILNTAATDGDELRRRMIDLTERTTNIANTAEAEGRPLNADELRLTNELFAEFESARTQLDVIDKVQNMHRYLSEPMPRGAVPPDMMDGSGSLKGFALGKGSADPRHARAGVLLPAGTTKPSTLLMPRMADAWNGQPESFFASIARGMFTPALMNAAGTTGDGESGGFAVPPSWYGGLIDQSLQAAELAPRCRLFMATGPTLVVPMPDYTDRQTDLAGLSGNWAAENSTQTAQRLRWRQVNVPLSKIFLLAESSSELNEDGLNHGVQLQQALTTAAAYSLDDAILAGNGIGKPLGIVHDSAAIAVNPDSGQTASTVTFNNLLNIYARVAPACQKRATWFVSPGVLPQLMSMVFPGSSNPVLLGTGDASNAAAGEPIGTIFGRPLVVTEIARPLGDPGDIVLADLSQYALVLRNSARIEFNAGPGFNRDVLQWRFVMRVGGQSMWNSPVTPYAGGSTLSYAAYLAARS